MGKTSVPKYTIRLCLIWLVPALSLFFGVALCLPFLLAAVLTPIEVPKVRQRVFSSKVRKQLPCLKVPALMRLSVLWLLQIWWLVLWRVESGLVDSDDTLGVGEDADALSSDDSLSFSPSSLSVVLPCAGEGEFALKTVQAVHATTPAEALKEIIIVDDGSDPPLTRSILTEEVRARYGVRVIRHEETVGLIGAKKDGGDVATGDIVVFFDCHVAPQQGWHTSFLRLVGQNYRRIVVPVITDLDVGSWTQRGGNKGQAKCYMTWDADFKWFDSNDQYVPIVSGGLLGISKRWWNETGGYDAKMVGWGGENLDQSLRSWLCGGEIVIAKDAFVAHMWRVNDDPRTHRNYTVKGNAANVNRMRAAVAWFGEFAEKLEQFPSLASVGRNRNNAPWYGDVGNILEVKERLQCRSYAWFMRRFRHVYEDGGLVPLETFALRSEVLHDKCLTFTGQAGTSPDGTGIAVLRPCNSEDHRQRWHGANRDTSTRGQPCCSGLRAWNTDQCIAGDRNGEVRTFVCDISGAEESQTWSLDSDGHLRKRGSNSFMVSSSCLEVQAEGLKGLGDDLQQATHHLPKADRNGKIKVQGCRSDGQPSWEKYQSSEPIESQLYRKALAGGEA